MVKKNLTKITIVLSFIVLLLISALPLSAQAREDVPVYEVYALRYGLSDSYPMPYLMYLADAAVNVPMDWSVWLIKGNGKIILVDTGCNEKMAKQWGVKGWIRSDKLLEKKMGIKPEEVTDIILTHLHWDHANNCNTDYFPNANIWMQRAELEFYSGEGGQNAQASVGMMADDIVRMVRQNYAGKVKLIEGDKEIFPGVKCKLYKRTHTFATQAVAVNTKAGTVVIAGDLVYRFDNIEKMAPIGTGLDMYECYKALVDIIETASSKRLVVPGHDPNTYERWTTPGNYVALIK